MWKRRLGYDETTFLQSLPENLQTEVALCLKKDVIEKVPFFRNASEEFKRDISLLLHPVFLTPGDYVFKENDAAEEMYFVVNGTLEVRDKTEKQVLRLLSDGDYFGEIALFKKQSRSATIKANTFCDVYTLDKASFEKVILKYPDFHKQLRLTIEQRENSDKRIETKIQ
jgi:voltage-gated potassium channel